MKTTAPIVFAVLGLSTFVASVAAAQTGKPGGPPPGWYGERQMDLRRGVPSDLMIVDVREKGATSTRIETSLSADGSPVDVGGPAMTVLVTDATVVDGADCKAG